MKLFKSLLLAPATLGFLAPLAANATEINLNDVSNYSDVDSIEFANSFDNEKSIKPTLLAGGEGLGNRHSHDGGFSDTTTLSGSAHFQMGAVEGASSEAVTATYSYDLDLNTSFTGEDNLYVGIEAGNSSGIPFSTDNSNTQGDTLKVDSLYYAFPVGEYEVAVGPKIDNDDFMPTSTSKYSDRFVMGGATLLKSNFTWDLGITGSGVAVSRTFDNGWNASASLIGLDASTSSGLLTKEGTDTVTLSTGYDGENYGLGLVYVDADEVCTFVQNYNTCSNLGIPSSGINGNSTTFGGYWTPNDGKTTVSANIGFISYEVTGYTTEALGQMFLGVDHQIGNGVLSAAGKSSDWFAVSGSNVYADYLGDYGEIYYTYDVNDSMELTGGFAFAMPDNAGVWTWADETAVGVEVTFKF